MHHERLFLRLDGDPLYAPETTVPAGTMRELAVPAALRGLVAHLIAYDERLPAGAVVSERVVPDGALRLILDFSSGGAQLVGPSARPVLLSMTGHMSGLSVTLQPGAALMLFGIPAHELAEKAVAWDDLVRAGHRGLYGLVQEWSGDNERARVLCAALQGMASDTDGEERRKAMGAAAWLRSGGHARSVRAVAAAVGISERRLQQIFRSQLGLSPAAWRRLMRVHECLRLLRLQGPKRWTDIALETGFYDQSHLVNEFRALCGLTPGQFLHRFVSGFSKTPV
ncbi:helix-turn-helix domain-containing protein [Ramlibacter rhizophilus]|uniref:AraC family transcriptional regulator n=1 Tax=Ramlibacter rhizophilus TaxID=1781167 RepID=A0A4Z0BZ63_9BURK|nr:helix-turn-helix domain-containing protein [Ramlibacter rhizophilus]TFZ04513.1 AraC family transcriptional regulator [Ramlibacter rhizophilus]